jgi:sigma-E factor negative regulatory protein RseB
MSGRGAGLILLGFLSLRAFGADPGALQALEIVNHMSRAVRSTNYDGVFIYRHERQTDSMRLIHRGTPGPEQERLISLTGKPREVIRNGDTVTCIYPEDQAVMVSKTRPRSYVVQLPETAESYAKSYAFAQAGEDRVAGRDAWVVGINPMDVYRYGYQIWVDKETYLPLKTELRSRSGTAIEEVMFTQMSVMSEIPDALLQPGIAGQDFTWFHAAAAEDRGPAIGGKWRVTWMPEGFRISHHERQALVASGDPVDHLVYTDGVASVSVFVEPLHDAAPQVGPRKIGGISTFGKLEQGHQITAVGEVPPATVQRMANSVISD